MIYLLSTFISGEDRGRLMVTTDLQRFHPVGTTLNNPESGGVRDWNILPTGDGYFAFSTAGILGAVDYFAVDQSPDLMTWRRVAEISVSELGAVTHVWSPFTYEENGIRHVFISVSTDNLATLRLYRAQFTDATFTEVTEWQEVEIAGMELTSIIGLNIARMGGRLRLWFKNEATLKICTAWGGSPDGPFVFEREVFPAGFEGAGLVNTSGPNWTVLIDKYSSNRGVYRSDSTDDGATWSEPAIIDPLFDQISNSFVIKAESPKMMSDIVAAMALLTPRAIANGGYDRPVKQTGPNHSGYWAGGKIGFLHFNTYTDQEACTILANCQFDGANYYCIDTSRPAWLWLLGFGPASDGLELYRADATTGACNFVKVHSITPTGTGRFNSLEIPAPDGTKWNIQISNIGEISAVLSP